MSTQYIGVGEAAWRLSVPYRKALDWLFSGKLRGRRDGNRWRVELASVQALEGKPRLVRDDPTDGKAA